MKKETKAKIKQLKNQKKYDEIFINYGSSEYVKNTPRKLKNEELKKLIKEGKYEAIYNKFGENTYNQILEKARYNEIKEANGLSKAILFKIRRFLPKSLAVALFASSSLIAIPTISSEILTRENSIIYGNQIEDYNNKISDYAEEIKSLDLENDLQIFMKVIDDMWKNIQGYKEPEKDVYGYLELSISNKDGYGVCRHFASDVAKKLNAINPEYNARVMIVKMNDGGFYMPDIKRTILEQNETVSEGTNSQENFNLYELVSNVIGNHAVTLANLPGQNTILVIDPTNPSIGIYKDGKIKLFNSSEKNGMTFDPKELATAIYNGFDGAINSVDYIASFEETSSSLDELAKEYGYDEQQKALKEVREKEAQFKEDLKADGNFEEELQHYTQNNTFSTLEHSNEEK